MRVQITNYGVQKMASTGEPLEITKYVLGSEAGYTPMMDATGIQGTEVYSGSPTEIEIVNANVYKYQIGLDYNVGNFNFGEVALYDSTGACVAVGVSESIISKLKTSGSSGGNSVVLGVYMSMAAKNYAMWIDALASNNQYSVPILETVDNLGTTADAYPNFYIIRGASSAQSSVLAYTSKDGLWYFDAYSYSYQLTLTVANCTSTTLQFKTDGLTSDELSDITALRYYGDKIIEFASGNVYSICRNIKSVSIVGNTATISFSTPLAQLPVAGDTFIIFSRSAISTTDTVMPPASEDTIGAVKPGDFLEVDEDGRLNVTLKPATAETAGIVKPGHNLEVEEDGTLNYVPEAATEGQIGAVKPGNRLSVDGEGTLNYVPEAATADQIGDVKPGKRLSVKADGTLDYVPTAATAETIGEIKPGARLAIEEDGTLNYTPTAATASDIGDVKPGTRMSVDGDGTLSYVPTAATEDQIGDVKPGERLAVETDGTIKYVPTAATADKIGDVKPGVRLTVQEDGTVDYVPTAATAKQIGDVKPGDHISVREDGTLDVDLSRETLFECLAPFNESESLLQLSKTGDEQIAGKDGTEFSGARIKERQLAYGSAYFAGTWDAATNSINSNPYLYLKDGGILVDLTPSGEAGETTQQVKIIATLPSGEEVEVCPCEDPRCICPYHMDTLPEGSTTRTEIIGGSEKPEGTTKEYAPKGYIYQITVAGSTEIDGNSNWKVGDLVYCTGSSWKILNNRLDLVEKPESSGFVVLNSDGTTKAVSLKAGNSGIKITSNGQRLVWDLSATGVEAGEHAGFITVDKYGRVSAISDRLVAGTF